MLPYFTLTNQIFSAFFLLLGTIVLADFDLADFQAEQSKKNSLAPYFDDEGWRRQTWTLTSRGVVVDVEKSSLINKTAQVLRMTYVSRMEQ